jgi:quercetin dioxygenase-like cupin family protein
MSSEHQHTNVHRHLAEGTSTPTLDVLGPTIEFLTVPDETAGGVAVMRGVIPPGVVVPLHSHDDAEAFFIVAGAQQVLTEGADGLEWNDVHAGDYVNVPPGSWHAFRNVSQKPVVDLIVTTARLARFFQEVGKPATDSPQPPTPEDVERFVTTSATYGYRLGTPEQNQAAGIELPKF